MKRRIRFGWFAVFAVALLLVIASAPYTKRYVETRQCGKHLAAISQAAQVWAQAHNGRLPNGFVMMSNELASTRVLLCPGDKSRDPADNWQAFNSANSSYQISERVSAAKDLPPEILQNTPYLQCKVHYRNYAKRVSINNVYNNREPSYSWQRHGPGSRYSGEADADVAPS